MKTSYFFILLHYQKDAHNASNTGGAIRKPKSDTHVLLLGLVKCITIRIDMRIKDRVMDTLYNHEAPKKPTNLSINSDLLKKTKALNINLSATLEQALRSKLAETEAAKWKQTNKKAIRAYNDFIESNGTFADEYRSF